MKTRLTAFLISGVMLTTAAAAMPVPAVYSSDTDEALKKGDMRITLVDYYTGNPIKFDGNAEPYLWSDITYFTTHGKVSSGPIFYMHENSMIWENMADYFNADSFEFGLNWDGLPKDYSIPDESVERAGYFNGKSVPDNFVTVTKYDNGSADVEFRLINKNKSPAPKEAYESVIGTLPDWTPMDFADAMHFYNEHGKCYLKDNFICMVKPIRKSEIDKYGTRVSGSMTNVNTPAGTERKIYELEIPEKPDSSDEKAIQEYHDYLSRLEIVPRDYSFFEEYAKKEDPYVFEFEMFRVLEGLDLTLESYEKEDGEIKVLNTYTFENPDGDTIETDINKWLPDCKSECRFFASPEIYGNYIAYHSTEKYYPGTALTVEQKGEGAVEKAYESECSKFSLVPLDGNEPEYVRVYKPVADGRLNISFTVGKDGEEPFNQAEFNCGIKNNCSEIINYKGHTVFTFIDKDTGELIPEPKSGENFFFIGNYFREPLSGQIFNITSNPCAIKTLHTYNKNDNYTFNMKTASGRYDMPEFEVTYESSDCMDITCKLKWIPNGDANNDGEFSIADTVLLQRWLLSDNKTKLNDWKVLDFCRDNTIDVFDLILMKKQLTKKFITEYIEPENKSEYGYPLVVEKDNLKMYLGPDENYPCVAELPQGTPLREFGYNTNDDNWLFTEYEGKSGWVRTINENGEWNVYFEAMADKPVIYLYPEQKTDVHVELELTESELSTTYPKYNNGWDVTAYPDGSLLNKADGTHHKYLFWDSKNCRTRFDFSQGFCVAGSDTEAFFKEKLSYMGMTEEEMNEFIVYWLPRMEHNRYNLISFQGDVYTKSAKLNITPQPDSLCRIFMAYVPLENAVEIEPQQLDTFERKGFAVLEWGGCEIKAGEK